MASQRAEGWVLVPDRYDDGGFSGGTLERPALRRLLADIEAGRVDVIVVYKIDRLSRSLMDFAKLVEVFDATRRHLRLGHPIVQHHDHHGPADAEHPAVSFAQFEREVIGERIRDKFAASRARGMWMGGKVPLGYDVRDRKLVINEAEAATVRRVFEGFRRDRLGHEADAGAARRGRDHEARQADRQGRHLQAAEQPDLRWRGRAQGKRLSRRARGDHPPRAVGPGACHPGGKPAGTGQQEPSTELRRCCAD